MNKAGSRVNIERVLGLGCLFLAGGIIFFYSPETIGVEAAVVMLMTSGVYWTARTLLDKKISVVLAVGLGVFLVLNRLGFLDLLTFILTASILMGVLLI